MLIVENFDLNFVGCEKIYVKDENYFVGIYRDHIVFIDLTNAMRNGKVCRCTTMNISKMGERSAMMVLNGFIDDLPIERFFDNIRAGFYDGKRFEYANFTLEFRAGTRKSNRVFTPFGAFKKVNLDKICRLNEVVKAILAGQIGEIICEGIYTDDYAYDAMINYNKGNNTDVISMAKELCEERSGWHIIEKNSKSILIACHSFNYQRLMFTS